MENTEQRGTGIENGSEWLNGTVHFDRTGPTEKGGPPRFSKLFQLDRTDLFRFRPKFPEILAEWIVPIDICQNKVYSTIYYESVTHMRSRILNHNKKAKHKLTKQI